MRRGRLPRWKGRSCAAFDADSPGFQGRVHPGRRCDVGLDVGLETVAPDKNNINQLFRRS
jgi:hypothetical protein